MNPNLKPNLKQSSPVITADNYRLGQAHALYHRQAVPQPELALFADYLMVVNLSIGDDFYVPTAYIDEARESDTAVYLTLTRDEVEEKQLTRIPQFIIDDQYTEGKLPASTANAADIPEAGMPLHDEIVPLPPNMQSHRAEDKKGLNNTSKQ